MYQSPISIYETAMETIMEQRENAIFAKVQEAFDVQVDKAELIRALQYDRDQYEKGYRDAKQEQKWIPVSERLPERPEYDWVLVQVKMNPEDYYGVPHIAELRNGTWYDEDDLPLEEFRSVKVTHWMPLPEPPKEGE